MQPFRLPAGTLPVFARSPADPQLAFMINLRGATDHFP
jgi:hypothetical protein